MPMIKIIQVQFDHAYFSLEINLKPSLFHYFTRVTNLWQKFINVFRKKKKKKLMLIFYCFQFLFYYTFENIIIFFSRKMLTIKHLKKKLSRILFV